MSFTKTVPEWKAAGTEPPSSLKISGFTAGYKPPAPYFNWFWYSVSQCLAELQTVITADEADIAARAKTDLSNVDNSVFLSKASAAGAGGVPIVTTAGTGAAYTATVNGVSALTTGLLVVIVPHTVSTSTTATLNINSLGAKAIKQATSATTSAVVSPANANFMASGKPVLLMYNGTNWVTAAPRSSASDMYGTLGIANGGTGGTTVAAALKNLAGMTQTGNAPSSMPLTYANMAATGVVSASSTTEAFCKAMANYQSVAFVHSTDNAAKLTDAPANYGVCFLFRGYNENYLVGMFFATDGNVYRYKYHSTNTGSNGWKAFGGDGLTPASLQS